jgi:hypothetical protein
MLFIFLQKQVKTKHFFAQKHALPLSERRGVGFAFILPKHGTRGEKFLCVTFFFISTKSITFAL